MLKAHKNLKSISFTFQEKYDFKQVIVFRRFIRTMLDQCPQIKIFQSANAPSFGWGYREKMERNMKIMKACQVAAKLLLLIGNRKVGHCNKRVFRIIARDYAFRDYRIISKKTRKHFKICVPTNKEQYAFFADKRLKSLKHDNDLFDTLIKDSESQQAMTKILSKPRKVKNCLYALHKFEALLLCDELDELGKAIVANHPQLFELILKHHPSVAKALFWKFNIIALRKRVRDRLELRYTYK